RGYTAAAGLAPDPAAVALYRETAYRALLVQLGTSYDELRTLRTGTAAERQALADRLGVGSDPSILDALLIAPASVTEQALETVFGLESTTRDPLAGAPLSQLFRARAAHLRTVWRREDHAAGAPVIVDPDIVPLDAIPLSKRSAGNLAFSLWTARRDWIAGQVTALTNDRLAGEADQPRLARLVGVAAAPTTMAALLALDADRTAGRDITAGVESHGLSLAAFDFLVRMHAAAGRGPLLAAEWDDVVSLLVQLAKLRRAAQWRTEEAALVLGPDDFQVADMPRIAAWRGTAAQWRAWNDRLQARTDYDQATVRGYADAVASAEAAALPVLRDALVAAVAPAPMRTPEGLEKVANWLTQRLMVDVQASSALRTTRLSQAVETLQGILGALRAGRFMEMDLEVGPLPPGDWTLTVKDVTADKVDATFDLEWAWMGGYASWQAAMRVFLYPENLLLPTLRESPSAEFRAALATRGPGPLSAEGAEAIAAAYLAGIAANATATNKLNAVVPAWGANGWKTQTRALVSDLAETELPPRAAAIRQMMLANTDAAATRTYLEELFFWMPMQLALLLQQAGQHTAALDWFRTVYGYNLKAGQRKVYYGLIEEETFPCVYQTTDQWLRTELNPHEVAPQRAGALTRFTLLAIARCFVAFADEEFAADRGEAAARARTLYLAALELLGSS
ncbi:MAG TPA: neuraminidase-like domain-containing protein, partial [Longimicrobiaceae bacterium]